MNRPSTHPVEMRAKHPTLRQVSECGDGVRYLISHALQVACRAVLLCLSLGIHAAELRIGQSIVPPGMSVKLPVTLADPSDAVAAQFDVNFDASLMNLTGVTVGDALSNHTVDFQRLSPGRWRVLVYSANGTPIEPGSMVWLSLSISGSAPNGPVPLGLTDGILARIEGQSVAPLAHVNWAVIVTAPSPGGFLALAKRSDGRLDLEFRGVEGRQYVLQASTNLRDWLDLTTSTVQGGVIRFVETDTGAHPQRFFRARQLP